MPIFRRTKTVCYCIWCIVLVLLDVDGSGCGALSCRMRALWRFLFNSANRYCSKYTGYSCHILTKTVFSRQIFRRIHRKINFHENPFIGPCERTDGRTDRHDDANSRIFAILRSRPSKQRILSHVPLTDFHKRDREFTARYELNL